jgi:hypothetical protein
MPVPRQIVQATRVAGESSPRPVSRSRIQANPVDPFRIIGCPRSVLSKRKNPETPPLGLIVLPILLLDTIVHTDACHVEVGAAEVCVEGRWSENRKCRKRRSVQTALNFSACSKEVTNKRRIKFSGSSTAWVTACWCPFWVRSGGHLRCNRPCPLYPQKRISAVH